LDFGRESKGIARHTACFTRTGLNPPESSTPRRSSSKMKRSTNEIRGPGGVLPLRAADEAAVDLLMLVDGETSGRNLDEVLTQYDRSRSTYYEKLRRFREEGLEGLLARPPGPRHAWRRPLEVVRHIVTTRLRHPDRGAPAIAEDLARLGHEVSARSVERTLSQFGLTRPVIRAAPRVGRASGRA
jgi:transposase